METLGILWLMGALDSSPTVVYRQEIQQVDPQGHVILIDGKIASHKVCPLGGMIYVRYADVNSNGRLDKKDRILSKRKDCMTQADRDSGRGEPGIKGDEGLSGINGRDGARGLDGMRGDKGGNGGNG